MNLIEGNQQLGYIFAATLFSLFGLLFMWICYSGVKERYVETQPTNPAQKPGLLQSFRAIAGNRPLFILCIANLCTLGAFNVKLAIQVYYTQYVLNDPILLSYMGFFSMGCIFIGVFLMPGAVRRFGKKKVYIGGLLIWVLGDLLNYFFGGGSVSFVAFSCLAFFGSAFVNSLNWALVSDTVEYGEWRTGVRSEGTVYTGFTFFRKVSQALAKIMAEDVTVKVVNDSENHQTLLYGMGEQHLEVIVSELANRYKVEVTLETPKVAFRETIRRTSDIDTKYKKQSGGHGQYGHVKMKFEPSGDLETPYIFEETVVGGAVPKNYFPAVEKGLQESVGKGPLAGYPVVGVKATLYDGSYHPVDSSEMAFKTATMQAFKKGIMEASPVLLEPIATLKVTVPDEYTGDVMGDLNKRRGRVLGMTPVQGGKQIIEADIPMTGVFGYCTVLRSMTGGRGTYEYEFARYEQAPSDVQEKEIAKRAAEE